MIVHFSGCTRERLLKRDNPHPHIYLIKSFSKGKSSISGVSREDEGCVFIKNIELNKSYPITLCTVKLCLVSERL